MENLLEPPPALWFVNVFTKVKIIDASPETAVTNKRLLNRSFHAFDVFSKEVAKVGNTAAAKQGRFFPCNNHGGCL